MGWPLSMQTSMTANRLRPPPQCSAASRVRTATPLHWSHGMKAATNVCHWRKRHRDVPKTVGCPRFAGWNRTALTCEADPPSCGSPSASSATAPGTASVLASGLWPNRLAREPLQHLRHLVLLVKRRRDAGLGPPRTRARRDVASGSAGPRRATARLGSCKWTLKRRKNLQFSCEHYVNIAATIRTPGDLATRAWRGRSAAFAPGDALFAAAMGGHDGRDREAEWRRPMPQLDPSRRASLYCPVAPPPCSLHRGLTRRCDAEGADAPP